MNPITVATILLMMLATISKASSNNGPSARSKSYSSLIRSQISLQKEEAEKLQSTTVKFYFTVDSSGKISSVKAVTSKPELRQMLEEKFRKIVLKGYPADQSNSIQIRFLLQ